MQIKALPFLLPSASRISGIEWLETDGSVETLPEILPHWDTRMPVKAITRVNLDIQGIWEDCKLDQADTLRLALLWNSPGTGLRGRGGRDSFIDLKSYTSSTTMLLQLDLNGELLSDNVIFTLQLVLSRHGKGSSRLSPHLAGSVLWEESKTIALQEEDSRFPIEFVDFSISGWLPEGAVWFLYWDPDALSDKLLGNVRLFLNERNSKIVRAVSELLPEDQPLREMIKFDVARAMISSALINDDFLQNHSDYPAGTTGDSIRRLLRAIYPNESIDSLAQRRQNLARFECDLQDRFHLFPGE